MMNQMYNHSLNQKRATALIKAFVSSMNVLINIKLGVTGHWSIKSTMPGLKKRGFSI